MHHLDKQKHEWHSKSVVFSWRQKKIGSKNVLRFRLDSVNFQVFWAEICTMYFVYLYKQYKNEQQKNRHPTHTTDAQKSKKRALEKYSTKKQKCSEYFSLHILMEFDKFLIIALGCWTHKTHAFSCVNQLLYFICNYTSIACRYIVYICYSIHWKTAISQQKKRGWKVNGGKKYIPKMKRENIKWETGQ